MDILYLLLFIASVTLLPWWMLRRARRVRSVLAEPEQRQSYHPQSEEWVGEGEADGADSGLRYGKAHNFNEGLADAEKISAGVPDIVKTFEGRR